MGKSGVAALERSNWQVAHEALSRLARERAVASAEEGRWLLVALRSGTHLHLGFASFGEYVERMFGDKPRSTQEKLRVAEALEQLPGMARALAEGHLHWSAARELTRVAVAETEREWVELAHGKTLRQLEELVAGKRSGDRPSSPSDPSAQLHVLRFEVAGETLALFREATSELRRRSDAALTDDAVLLEMARRVLGGPRDEGRASYQVVVSVCPACSAGRQAASAELLPVAAEVVAMACCDGQHVGQVASAETGKVGHGLGAGAPANQNAHVGARATQSIPPARRRAVMLRDQHRCRVPGCRNSTFVDVHHIELRSKGGQHSAENLLVLCGAHHRAVHRGELLLQGNAVAGVVFRHADGRDYGELMRPTALDVQTKVCSALRNLGFREGEVRAALAQVRNEDGLHDVTPEALLRAALGRLRSPRTAC